jgi:hypothetical protein
VKLTVSYVAIEWRVLVLLVLLFFVVSPQEAYGLALAVLEASNNGESLE